MAIDITPFSDAISTQGAAPKAAAAPESGPKLDITPFSDQAAGGDSLFDALIWQESRGRQTNKDGTPVTSSKGATGIAQVMPKTAPEAAALAGVAFDDVLYRTDAAYNKKIGRAYWDKQMADFGDPAQALAAYNAGPGALRAALAKAEQSGEPGAWLRFLPAETQAYVPKIMQRAGQVAATQGDRFTDVKPRVAPERTALEAVGDVALGTAQGVVSGVGMLASVAGADNPVARGADALAKDLGGMQSPYRQAQRQDRAETIKAAEESGSTLAEIGANLGALWEAPIETVLNAVGSSAPTLLMAAIPGLGQAAAARLVLMGAMGAAQGGGAVKGSIYESVTNKLVNEAGMAPSEAEKVAAAAQAYDSENGGQIALGAVLGVLAGTSGAEAALSGIMGRKVGGEVSKSVLKRAAIGGASESVPEGIQGGQERVAANVALQNEGFDVPTFQGAAGQAALEAAASAPMGAGLGALNSPAIPPALQPVADKAATPEGTLSRAAIAGTAAQPPQSPVAPVDPAARIAELEAKTRGTPDQTHADGTVLKGVLPQLFTAEEQAEYQDLKARQTASQEAAAANQPEPVDPKEQARAAAEAKTAEQSKAFTAKAAAMKEALGKPGVLDAFRADTSLVDVQKVINDLAIARSESSAPRAREEALGRLEFALEWAGVNPAAQVATGIEEIVGDAPKGEAREPAKVSATQQLLGVDRDKELQANLAEAPAEADREGVQAQAAINREKNLGAATIARPPEVQAAIDLLAGIDRSGALPHPVAVNAVARKLGLPTDKDEMPSDTIDRVRAAVKKALAAPAENTAPIAAPVAAITAKEQARLDAAAAKAKANLTPERQALIATVMENIEDRNGAAAPWEAHLLEESGLGKPYDRVDEGLSDAPLTDGTAGRLAQANAYAEWAKGTGQDPQSRIERAAGVAPSQVATVRPIATTTPSTTPRSSSAATVSAAAEQAAAREESEAKAAELRARTSGATRVQPGEVDLLASPAREGDGVAATEPNSGSTVPKTADIETPAVFRKRRAALRTVIDTGLNQVERRGEDYVLTDGKKFFVLEGPADAQLARAEVKRWIDEKAHNAATSPNNDRDEPSWAQIDANGHGNWKKGDRFKWFGQTVVIENPEGSIRRSRPDAKKPWQTTMKNHYGDLKGTVGADDDAIDVFIGAGGKVFVIDQIDPATGKFDEHKVMMGFPTADAARIAYQANYAPVWKGLGAITQTDQKTLNDWAHAGKVTKPFKETHGTAGSADPGAAAAGNAGGLPDAAGRLANRGAGAVARADGAGVDAAAGAPGARRQGNAPAADASPADGHVIVTVNGRQLKLETVKREHLSESPNRRDGLKGRQITKANGELISKLAALLGKKVVYFRDPDGQQIGDGFVKNDDERTIYLNEVSGINPLAVLGHEFFHLVKREMPEAYAAISKVVRSRLKGDAPHQFRNDYHGRAEGPNSNHELGEGDLEELISDLGGNLFADPTFWPEVFEQIAADNPQNSKGVIASLAAMFNRFIEGLVKALQGQPKFKTDALITDMQAVRAAFKEGLAKHIAANGISRIAMQAEILKAGQEAKRSAGREPQWWKDGRPVESDMDALEAASGDVPYMLDEDDLSMEWRIATVPINEIADSDGAPPEPERFQERLAVIRAAKELDRPILELSSDGRAKIIDGWHRLQVMKERGKTEVSALVGKPDVKRSAPRTPKTSDNPTDEAGLVDDDGANRAAPGAADGPSARYGKAQAGSVSATGVHFSKQPRTRLDSAHYGAGYKGAEAKRLEGSENADIRPRTFFYVDKGNGVRPEDGVGAYAHRVQLDNLYDAQLDNLNIVKRNPGANNWERAIHEAGFDGYLSLDPKAAQGFAVLIGKHSVPVEQIERPGFSTPSKEPEALKKGLMSRELGSIAIENIPGATLKSGTLFIPATSAEAANDEMERIGSSIRFSKARPQDSLASEYAAVEKQYRGTDQWLKAPDGSPTNLTERQWVHVRTRAFKQWFGDWEAFTTKEKPSVWYDEGTSVSKVVDANGEPLVVYHGSDKGGFSEFAMPGGTGRGDLGIFTTNDFGMARSYVRRNGGARRIGEDDIQGADSDDDSFKTVPGVYALFVNLRNPNEENFEGAQWTGERPGMYQVRDQDDEPVYDAQGRAFFDQETAERIAEENEGAEVQPAEMHWSTTDGVIKQARANKVDGAIIREVIDDGGGPGYADQPADIFVVFDPNQVKSADFNGGEYSVSEDDIRLSNKRDPAIGDRTDVAQLPKGREIPQSAAVGSLEQSLATARAKSYNRGRDLKLDIQARVLAAAKAAKVDLAARTQATHRFLAAVVADDAKYALQSNENAVGWYDSKVSRALGALSTVHPEIETDLQSRLAFLWALATTSNGLKVGKNFELAEAAYRGWKEAGAMPTDIGIGNAASAINDTLALFNELTAKLGHERLMKFASTEFTVGQIEGMLGHKVTGEWKPTPVRGAALLGPKIGNGFFSNLNGYFDALTMDRWLMRTWGRLTGTLVDINPAEIKRTRLKLQTAVRAMTDPERRVIARLVGAPVRKDLTHAELDVLAGASQKASMKVDKREVMQSTSAMNELRKAANNHFKTLDGQKEAPAGPGERNWIRAVFRTALEQLRAGGTDMTMSDLQALLWYPERRLYDAAKSDEDVADGYEDDEAPDYANAAMNLALANGVSRKVVDKAMDRAEARGTVKGQPLTEDEKQAMLKEFRAPPPQGVQLAFEVAPDPNNEELTAQWGELSLKERAEITKAVKEAVLSEVMDAVGLDELKTVAAIGGYAGLVNPNLIAEYKVKKVSLEQARALAVAIGMALDQDSVALVDPRVTDTVGMVRVTLSEKAHKHAERLLAAIQAVVPEVDGFTARGNNFDILNFTDLSNEELAGKINEALDEIEDLESVVSFGDTHSTLIEKGSYAEQIEGVRSGSGQDVRERIERARDRAREIVAQGIEAARAGRDGAGDGAAAARSAAARTDEGSEEVSRSSSRVDAHLDVNGEAERYQRRGYSGFMRKPKAQSDLTSTPEFKRWFGADSTLVNADGSPMRLYHGTGAKKFTTFKRSTYGAMGPAVYLGDDIEVAMGYKPEKGGRIMEVYARGKYLTNMQWSEYIGKHGWTGAEAAAKADGWSGIHDTQFESAVAVWDPSDIKSAPDNNGEFGENDNIKRSTNRTVEVDGVRRPAENSNGQPVHPTFQGQLNFWRWFGGSKVVDEDGSPLVVYHGTGRDVSEFSMKGAKYLHGLSTAGAAFFTPDAKEASWAANQLPYKRGETDVASNVMPVYLSVKNPLIIDQSSGVYPTEFFENGHAYPTLGDVERIRAAGHDGVAVVSKGKAIADATEIMVFDSSQIKSATGNDGSFSKDDADITRSPARPTFYSQLEVAIESVPERLATMAAPQWKLWLDANAGKLGVKKDEIEWSGLLDYLKLRGKDKVTRDELSAYVRENGVQVKDVVLGKSSFEPTAWGEWSEWEDEPDGGMERSMLGTDGYKITEEEEGESFRLYGPDGEFLDEYRSLGAARNAADQQRSDTYGAGTDATKFGNYTLPGGKSYREVLITLPTAKANLGLRATLEEKYGLTGASLYRALTDEERGMWDREKSKPEYRSSHWDAPNVLAHLRVDDRTDAEGKRVLFINEIQSDWGQQGKKDGFAGEGLSKPLQAMLERAEVTELADVGKWALVLPDGSKFSASSKEQVVERARTALMTREQSSVPKGPFVTDTKSWVALALKRAMMMAVENGQDKVAWVTGEQAADFFDLSKQVDELHWSRTDGKYDLKARKRSDGEPGWQHDIASNVDEDKLADYVGKDVAQKIIDAKDKKWTGTLSGLDLKVGGEGMRGFYDKIVPQVANDVLKKIGGGKVGSTTITTDKEGWHITPPSQTSTGKWMVKSSDYNSKGLHFATEAEAKTALAERRAQSEQPSFDITPAMKEKLEGGVALFSKAREVEETPEFKKWFGDSKVVEAKGKPLVVYHGSTADFDSFDTSGANEVGSWFAAPAKRYGDEQAISDAQEAAAQFAYTQSDQDGGPEVVYPVYLSIQNPKIFRGYGGFEKWARRSADGAGLRASLTAEGFDGIVIRNSKTDSGELRDDWVAFEPNQIKSAIGNDGNFDPNSADISRSAIRDTNIGMGYKVADLLDSSKKVSWWDKTVGTPYHLAERHPAFKRVYDAVQSFIGDVSKYATRAADLAPNILPKLEHMKDLFASPLSAADVKALADPIFLGTLSYTRDNNGDPVKTNDVGLAGVVWHDDELKSMWNLDERQIKLYREFRRATNKSIADMAITHMVRYGGADALGVREAMLKAPTIKVAAEILANELGRLASLDPERSNTLLNTARGAKEIAQMAQGLIAKGYAPLSRFGDYTVYITRNGGKEQVFFGMYETQREANKAARAFREDPMYKGADIKTGTMSKEAHKLFKGITPETLALFGEALGLEESASDQQSQVFQEYLKLAKTNRGAMKHMIERKGVSGYSEDAGRVLAAFVYSNARQSATNLHAGEIAKSANDVADGDLKDQAIKLTEYAQNPQEEAAALRGMLFGQYIGGSIASALVNTTQSITTTWPKLSEHFGIGKAGRAMSGALGIVKNGAGSDSDLEAAMKRAEEEGITAPQETHQLMAQAQGRGTLESGDGTKVGDTLAKLGNSWAKLQLVWGKGFGYAEMLNRKIAFISAYKLAREKGIAEPFEFAKKIVAETQYVMNKGNNPVWARGPVGATLFTFRKFMINYLEGLARQWGNGPEGKKAFAMSLAIMFFLAGAGGFPFADDLDDIIDGFMQRVLNKSFSSKQAKKEFFAKLVGDAGAEFVTSGISGLPGMPIDFSGRLGLGNVIPGTGLLAKKQDHSRDVAEITGAAGDMARRAITAVGALATGEPGMALEAAAPIAVTNVLKAKSMAELGYYKDLKGRKVIDTTLSEAILKGVGFQPQSVKQVQDSVGVQQSLIAQNKIRETEIADLWAKGRIERKPELIEDAKRQLREWNQQNPHSPISIEPSQINKRVQAANMTKAQRLAKTAPKEIKADVKRALEPAVQ